MKWWCIFPLSIIYYSTFGIYTTKKKRKEFTEIYNRNISFLETIEIIHDMMINILMCNFYEYINGLEKVNKNVYKLEYYHNNTQYYIPIILKKGRKPYVSKIIGVNNDVSIDVSNEIGKYLGPNVDFFNQNITPKMFGYERLIIYVNDIEKIFENDENIKI